MGKDKRIQSANKDLDVMTALQLVKLECANYDDTGMCEGISILGDGTMARFRKRGKCLIADGKACEYFEECVAPLVEMAVDKKQLSDINEALADYRKMVSG